MPPPYKPQPYKTAELLRQGVSGEATPRGVGANFSPRLHRDQSIAPIDVRSPYGPTPDLPRIWTRTEANCEPLKFGHARNLRRPTAAQTPLTGLSRAAAAEAPNPTFEQRFGHTPNDERVSPEALENTAPTAPRLGPGPAPPALFPELSTFLTYCLRFRPGDPVAASQTIRPWPGRTPRHQKRPLKIDPVRRLRAARRKSCVSINEAPGCSSPQLATNQGVERAYQILVCVLKFSHVPNFGVCPQILSRTKFWCVSSNSSGPKIPSAWLAADLRSPFDVCPELHPS